MTSGEIRLAVPLLPQTFGPHDWPPGVTLRGHGPEYWSGRTCGVACLRMILTYFRRPAPNLFTLLAEGLSRHAFNRRGWVHAGLADLARRHGLTAHAQALDLHDIGDVLHRSGPVIISIAHHFPVDGRRGGHLVAVAGRLDIAGEAHLEVRDPSPAGPAFQQVPLSRVAASYTGRAILPASGQGIVVGSGKPRCN